MEKRDRLSDRLSTIGLASKYRERIDKLASESSTYDIKKFQDNIAEHFTTRW